MIEYLFMYRNFWGKEVQVSFPAQNADDAIEVFKNLNPVLFNDDGTKKIPIEMYLKINW